MKKILLLLPVIVFAVIVSFFAGRASTSSESHIFELSPTPVPTPLAKYSIDTMKAAVISPAQFMRSEVTKEETDFNSVLFSMRFDPTLSGGSASTTTGIMNIPNGNGTFPLVIMIRGYVDPSIYTSGVGTKNAGEYFAKNGFITVAPDFLGYAGSDTEAGNIFESRFQTYTTVISLLNSVATPDFNNLIYNKWDGKNIFIWAHSNGGQIALTSLVTTGVTYPTTLWAPVTKPFPYSVLYYTDESLDGGKLIRRELSKFESLYDVNNYSFTNYLMNINAPLKFSQGTADNAVPYTWTRSIANQLKKLGKDVTYNEYPGSDHNLRPAWNDVVESDLNFFRKWLK